MVDRSLFTFKWSLEVARVFVARAVACSSTEITQSSATKTAFIQSPCYHHYYVIRNAKQSLSDLKIKTDITGTVLLWCHCHSRRYLSAIKARLSLPSLQTVPLLFLFLVLGVSEVPSGVICYLWGTWVKSHLWNLMKSRSMTSAKAGGLIRYRMFSFMEI